MLMIMKILICGEPVNYNELFDLLRVADLDTDFISVHRWDEKVVIAGHELSDVYFEDDINAIWYNEYEDPEPFYYSELKVKVESNLNWIKFVFEA